jgi:hypothetical protein
MPSISSPRSKSGNVAGKKGNNPQSLPRIEPGPADSWGLDPDHHRVVKAWGLTSETVRQAGLHSEHDPVRRSLLLHGCWFKGPALVIPYFDLQGRRTGYAVARPSTPRVRSGKPVKYEAPAGEPPRPYIPPLQAVWQALTTPRVPIGIVEGPGKALYSSQEGFPCLGLLGMQCWSPGRLTRDEPRRLIEDLAGIDWRARPVLILTDTDPCRKPSIQHGACELARVLTERGARVRMPRLPLGPRGRHGRPLKTGIDDYGQRHGAEPYRRWVRSGWDGEARPRDLAAWRREMVQARLATVADALPSPGPPMVYLDRSPTGAGKSFADADAMRHAQEEAMRSTTAGSLGAMLLAQLAEAPSLTLAPSHAQCAEAVGVQQRHDLESAAYPALREGNCLKYEEAQAVQARGLSFMKALCPECPHREGCLYREQFAAAADARHAVATYARGAVSLGEIARGRRRLCLHEAPLDMLRPSFVTSRGLLAVELVALQAEEAAAAARDRGFYRHLARVARQLHGHLNGSNVTTEVPLPKLCAHEPEHLHRDLNEACLELGCSVPREAMRLALAAVLGQLSLLAVAVDERPAAGGATKLVRKMVGVARIDLPDEATVWLSDATADPAELEEVLGQAVRDITPAGRLLPRHPTLQVIPARDVTKRRKPTAVLPLLLGLLHDLPFRRVGLLTHRELADALPDLLEERDRTRLALVSYFGSGLSRGSNAWIGGACDCLIVLGTPRVGADAVRERLLLLGKRKAAARTREQAGWGADWWSGVTKSGQRVTVRCWHYTDHDWHRAYCNLVRSELRQAVGRGRGFLPEGIPVYVVSTENLAPDPDDDLDGRNGPPISDHPFAPLTAAQARVLRALYRDGQPIVARLSGIAARAGVSARVARKHLKALEAAGRARQSGRKWLACRCRPQYPPPVSISPL